MLANFVSEMAFDIIAVGKMSEYTIKIIIYKGLAKKIK